MVPISKDILSLLVADDDMDDLMLLLSAIRSFNKDVNISHAQDGSQLLEILLIEIMPDLILLDINMPKIDGIDCLRQIRSNSRFDAIPIIMYSTSANSETIEKCYQLGASRYFIKPFTYEDIIKFMKMILAFNWKKSVQVQKDKFVLAV